MKITPAIRHRRLYAFYESQTLNTLLILTFLLLIITDATQANIVPLIGAASTLFLGIGYSLWFWIKKPATERINPFLSNASSIITLVSLLIITLQPASIIPFVLLVVAAIIIGFITLIRKDATTFTV